MSPNRIFAIVLRQYYLIRGSFSRVIPLFVWVAIDIVLWGLITRYLKSVVAPQFNIVFVLMGAVLLWDFFIRVMQGVTMAFFEDVWSRNFLNIFATPLTVWEFVAGLVLTSIATSSVGLVMMLFLASAIFGLSFLSLGTALIPFLLILFMFGIALGVLGCSIVLRLGPASEWFIWPIPSVISPFAAVFYPVSSLPLWMQGVSHFLPLSYVFEGLRSILSGHGFSAGLLGWGLALDVVYLLGACWVFGRTYEYAVRTGLIARYSVENI